MKTSGTQYFSHTSQFKREKSLETELALKGFHHYTASLTLFHVTPSLQRSFIRLCFRKINVLLCFVPLKRGTWLQSMCGRSEIVSLAILLQRCFLFINLCDFLIQLWRRCQDQASLPVYETNKGLQASSLYKDRVDMGKFTDCRIKLPVFKYDTISAINWNTQIQYTCKYFPKDILH